MNAVKLTLIVVPLLFFAGCDAFQAGFGSGAVTAEGLHQMVGESQTKFITAVNELNAETARINSMKETAFVNPETITAVESLKGREKDPVTWVALASLAANTYFGGKARGKNGA